VSDMTAKLNRRDVIAAGLTAAGGLAVGFRASAAVAPGSKGDSLAASEDALNEINPWLVIGPDNSVLVRLVHSEMGQGTATALAMLAAEELGCDWAKVKIEYASANRNLKSKNVYGGQMTVGSQGVRHPPRPEVTASPAAGPQVPGA